MSFDANVETKISKGVADDVDAFADNSLSTNCCSEIANDEMACKESDDDRKLFVGGLSWETTENDLNEYFSRWGKVTQCIIKLNRVSGNSRGFGFVTMDSEESVLKVLSENEHWLKNKKIDPKRAKPTKEPLKKVFVGGVDPFLSEEQIKEYFSAFGKVESLDLPFDTMRNRRKHYIFVTFATEAAAKKAIAKERQEIFGRQCDVRVAVNRDHLLRQKNVRPWCGWYDPSYVYPAIPIGDFANFYPGFDPYLYNYYGYDYYSGAPASTQHYGSYTSMGSGVYRDGDAAAIATGGTKANQPMSRSIFNAHGTLNNTNTPVSNRYPGLSSHDQQAQDGGGLNFHNYVNSSQEVDHFPSFSSGFDFAHQPCTGLSASASATFATRP